MEILYLFYFHGKSVREISKMTNLSKDQKKKSIIESVASKLSWG
ncbi:hypothetical protein MWL76_22275 [Escherichia coli]|nr:hypothetical protein [Escherichia coli]